MLNARCARRGDRGFSLTLMALLLVALLGVAGLVVDLGSWQVQASRIQQAADAAALAGVVRLPDGFVAAESRAFDIARDNGFDVADPDVDVAVEKVPGTDESLSVTIRVDNIERYFTQVLRDGPASITRTATAQYIQPVPLGSPRNYLGTDGIIGRQYPSLANTSAVENFFLAISGNCSRREHGDRITPIAMNNPQSGTQRCTPGVGSPTPAIDNPEFNPNGYLFGVDVPEANSGTSVSIEMYDAPMCTNTGASGRPGTSFSLENGESLPYQVVVRRFDDLNPLLGTELSRTTYSGNNSATGVCARGSLVDGDCGTGLALCWTPLQTVTEAGLYTVQVNPVNVPATSSNHNHNLFALRAKRGGIFTPCTSDVAVTRPDNTSTPPTPAYDDACTQVYALEHVPVAARGTGTPVFFLSNIDARHNNKTMQVTLFDPAEGAEAIELLAPDGTPATFTWQVLCADANDPGASWSCTDGDRRPPGAISGGPTTLLNVGGNVNADQTAFTNDEQRGKYSNRLVRLTVKLPPNIATAYDGATWWKIRYTGGPGGFTGDRTTWSVRVLGDPVRLIPNTPPTTATPGP